MILAILALTFFEAINIGVIPPDANWHPTKGEYASE